MSISYSSDKLLIIAVLRSTPLDYSLKLQLSNMNHRRFLYFDEKFNESGDTCDRLSLFMGPYESMERLPYTLTFFGYITHIRIDEIDNYISTSQVNELIQSLINALDDNLLSKDFISLREARLLSIKNMIKDRNELVQKKLRLVRRLDSMNVKHPGSNKLTYIQYLSQEERLNGEIDAMSFALEMSDQYSKNK